MSALQVSQVLPAAGTASQKHNEDDHTNNSSTITKRPTRKRRKSESDDGNEASRKESLTGALARALVGTLAFVFRAPVRLFRPVKLSSWSLLEAMAQREGRKLSFRYMRTLIQRESKSFLPHLLIPPLLVNTTIGFCLFEAYSLTEAHLVNKYYPRLPISGVNDLKRDDEKKSDETLKARSIDTFTPLWIVALAGGAAGAAQCIVSAPLDNVRIVLTSQVNKPKRFQHGARTVQRPPRISWLAVARAAILPFAPEITHSKMVKKVAEGRKGSAKTSDVSQTESQRKLWEKRIKRWRGGVHGAGLVMSLARDSVGFSAFFLVFEMSRRLAFHVSLGVDRTIAFFNTSATLPQGLPADANLDEVTIENESGQLVRTGDISYSRSRTKTGRIIAALVLVIGGAFGAAIYELVGRPAELMRLVVWEGRKNWERGEKPSSPKAGTEKPPIGRQHTVGARTRYSKILRQTGSQLRAGGFLALRSGNSTGSNLSRIEGQRLQHFKRPPHPLKLRHKDIQKKSTEQIVQQSSSTSHLNGNRKKRHGQLKIKMPFKTTNTRREPHVMPPLSTRPSAYSLLLEHAQRTSSLRYPSIKEASLHINPTPVPKPILLFHTYFIAPFNSQDKQRAIVTKTPTSTVKPEGFGAKATSNATSTATNKLIPIYRRLLNVFNYRYPESSAPGSVRSVSQAQAWGSGRVAWAFRRLASPYGVGFMVFAWMSGDLSA